MLTESRQIGSDGIFSTTRLHGIESDVRIYNRALSDTEVQQLYLFESQPMVTLKRAVYASFSNLSVGTNYQLQVSGDLINWTNQAGFTATNSTMTFPQYWQVDDWKELFFRIEFAQ